MTVQSPFELSSLLHSGYQHPVSRAWQSFSPTITPQSLLYPIFVHDLPNDMVEISRMPGQYR